ncbi:MAG: hypothetical protein Ct9H300mP9_7950 [Candidatus Neomarinimicrobiota bacterium]|nr:MAG: hypothetical protein Ct9H300mP9_7950 [Candidatus Neomarinimicrobiota bacterium]
MESNILDVGSGSGGLAEKLILKGIKYIVFLQANTYQTGLKRIGEKVHVFRSTLESLVTNETYDLFYSVKAFNM